MKWRPIVMLVLVGLPISMQAADVIRPQPRKKFRLHSLGIGVLVSPDFPGKRIARPVDQSVGVMVQQEPSTVFTTQLYADFSPPLALSNDRYSWSGAASGQGPSIPAAYASEGNRTVVLTVDDKRTPPKTTSAAIRVRFVSATREIDLCNPASPSTFPLCFSVREDALTAAAWANSEDANSRWGWPPTAADNGRANAAQHSYWNVLMVRDFGTANARMFADAHERSPATVGNGLNQGAPHNGVVMDLDNNARGRQIGTGLTFTSSFPDNDPDGQAAVAAAILSENPALSLTVMDEAFSNDDGNDTNQGLLQPSSQSNP